MGLMYQAAFRNIALAAVASVDIWELVIPASLSVVIHEIVLSSQFNTDERIDVAVLSRTGTGSGGSAAITPQPLSQRNSTASGITSFKTLVTTPGTGGTLISWPTMWSQLAVLDLLPTPSDVLELPGGVGRYVLNNANFFVGATRQLSGWVTWEER